MHSTALVKLTDFTLLAESAASSRRRLERDAVQHEELPSESGPFTALA